MALTLSLRARALRLLAGREHSRLELSRKLGRHLGEEGSLEALAKLLDELEQAGWLSDQRFADQWVERRARRYGNARIRQELSARGVQSDLVDLPIEALENSEHVRALGIWQRRYGGCQRTCAPAPVSPSARLFRGGRGPDCSRTAAALKRPMLGFAAPHAL